MFDLMMLLKVGIVALSFAIGFGVRHFAPNFQEDNVIEEVAEEVIKQETGIDVDLTPKSPEKK